MSVVIPLSHFRFIITNRHYLFYCSIFLTAMYKKSAGKPARRLAQSALFTTFLCSPSYVGRIGSSIIFCFMRSSLIARMFCSTVQYIMGIVHSSSTKEVSTAMWLLWAGLMLHYIPGFLLISCFGGFQSGRHIIHKWMRGGKKQRRKRNSVKGEPEKLIVLWFSSHCSWAFMAPVHRRVMRIIWYSDIADDSVLVLVK